MDNGTALLNSIADSLWLEPVGPKLLVEMEPAHRVFFGNLSDLVLRHQIPGWRDIFVPAGALWWSFLESALWHTLALLVLLIVSRGVGPRKAIETRLMRRSHLVYYRPTFPALGSSRPRLPLRREEKLQYQRVLQVVRELRPLRRLIVPPDIAALTKPSRLLPAALNSAPVAPAAPMAATLGTKRKSGGIGVSVIAPPPEIKQAAGLRSNGFRAVIVAPAPVIGSGLKQSGSSGFRGGQPLAVGPAPEVPSVSRKRGIVGPKAGVVAPPPEAPGNSSGRLGIRGNGNLLHVEVIAPSPGLPMQELGARAGTTRSGLGGTGAGVRDNGVVPPPPSVEGSGTRKAGGLGPLGSDSAVVAPAPSIAVAARSGYRVGGGFAGGSGPAVVPPPPAVAGVGKSTGSGGEGGTGGLGFAAVPPPPSIEGAGGSAGSGTGGFPGSDSAVPPAPSLEGMGGTEGRGDGNSPAGTGSTAVPPPPSMEGVSGSSVDQGPNLVVEELPMRIVGLAFALPSTSFSSSYEVFIAEKDLKGQKELIKLVYWFLPYQTRLSEYHPDASKMFKLRVTRDHACDESLLHMTVSPTGQVYPGTHLPADSLQLIQERQDMILPCYRTTADDYRKATGRR